MVSIRFLNRIFSFQDFKLPVNELGYFVTRIEEEHLWEAKQLGAHSPQVITQVANAIRNYTLY